MVDTFRSAGLTQVDGNYGPAIAIGGIDMTPLDLTYGYRVLANGGVMRGQHTFAPRTGLERTIEPIAILRIDRRTGVVYDVNAAPRREAHLLAPSRPTWSPTSSATRSASCLTFGCGGLERAGLQGRGEDRHQRALRPKGPD